ncbi:MAG: CpaF family protein, partial [Pseudomonadota bacterium]
MFGRRTQDPTAQRAPVEAPAPKPVAATAPAPATAPSTEKAPEKPAVEQAPEQASATAPQPVVRRHSEEYYDVKTTVFNALIDTIDLTQLAKLDAEAAREEIRDIVSEIIQLKNVVMS